MSPPAPDQTQDSADMARLQAGQDAALDDLMDRHGERLFRYLVRLLQNDEDAADLAQEAFLRVYQHRAKFDSREKFSTWLYAIAGNLARDRFRWRTRHPQVSMEAAPDAADATLADTVASHAPTPSEALQAHERAAWVRQAIAALPEDLREPLVLAEYERLSQAEIGAILGCTAKAVEMRLYRARHFLRGKLERWCLLA